MNFACLMHDQELPLDDKMWRKQGDKGLDCRAAICTAQAFSDLLTALDPQAGSMSDGDLTSEAAEQSSTLADELAAYDDDAEEDENGGTRCDEEWKFNELAKIPSDWTAVAMANESREGRIRPGKKQSRAANLSDGQSIQTVAERSARAASSPAPRTKTNSRAASMYPRDSILTASPTRPVKRARTITAHQALTADPAAFTQPSVHQRRSARLQGASPPELLSLEDLEAAEGETSGNIVIGQSAERDKMARELAELLWAEDDEVETTRNIVESNPKVIPEAVKGDGNDDDDDEQEQEEEREEEEASEALNSDEEIVVVGKSEGWDGAEVYHSRDGEDWGEPDEQADNREYVDEQFETPMAEAHTSSGSESESESEQIRWAARKRKPKSPVKEATANKKRPTARS